MDKRGIREEEEREKGTRYYRNPNHNSNPNPYLGLLKTVERIYDAIEGHEHEAKELDDDDQGEHHDHRAEVLAVVGGVSHALLGD